MGKPLTKPLLYRLYCCSCWGRCTYRIKQIAKDEPLTAVLIDDHDFDDAPGHLKGVALHHPLGALLIPIARDRLARFNVIGEPDLS